MKSPIKEDREKRKLSQEELAKVVGVTRSAISLIERGEFIPSVVTLGKISTALKASNKRRKEYSVFYENKKLH